MLIINNKKYTQILNIFCKQKEFAYKNKFSNVITFANFFPLFQLLFLYPNVILILRRVLDRAASEDNCSLYMSYCQNCRQNLEPNAYKYSELKSIANENCNNLIAQFC